MEKYDANRDKFLDLMAKHHLGEGVNVVGLWEKAQQGEDIRPLAREFIADRQRREISQDPIQERPTEGDSGIYGSNRTVRVVCDQQTRRLAFKTEATGKTVEVGQTLRNSKRKDAPSRVQALLRKDVPKEMQGCSTDCGSFRTRQRRHNQNLFTKEQR